MTSFAGLTRESCPASCKAETCAISGKPWCSHPCKGGIPAALRNDPAVQKTFAEACKALAVPNPHTNPARLTP
jgi:hypothetical protein